MCRLVEKRTQYQEIRGQLICGMMIECCLDTLLKKTFVNFYTWVDDAAKSNRATKSAEESISLDDIVSMAD